MGLSAPPPNPSDGGWGGEVHEGKYQRPGACGGSFAGEMWRLDCGTEVGE